MRKIIFIKLCLLMSIVVFAQKNNELKASFNYEDWNTCITTAEKLTTQDYYTAYILSCSYAMKQNLSKANTINEAALKNFSNNPLQIVVKGYLQQLNGNLQAAKKTFDEALLNAGTYKQEVLIAIGWVMGHLSLKYSNPKYGIEMLKQAAIAEPQNGMIFINMGDCYRRMLEGGAAVQAYEDAKSKDINVKDIAYYKIANVYYTQQNCLFFEENISKALAIQPKYTAALQAAYDFYSNTESTCYNKETANKYFERYLPLLPKGIESDVYGLQHYYSMGNYEKVISESNTIIKKNNTQPIPKVYKILGYANYYVKNYTEAIKWLEEYFTNEQQKENIIAGNYETVSKSYSALNNPTKEAAYLLKAAQADTTKTNVIRYSILAADIYSKQKMYNEAASLYNQIVNIKANAVSATDLFRMGVAYYNLKDYATSQKTFTTYATKFPTDWRPSLWLARNGAQLDSTMKTWEAVPHYEKCIQLGVNDATAKSAMVEAYMYLFAYQYQNKKDKNAALQYLDKVLAIDPNNANAKKYKDLLSK
jgi:tetratricopeptide (TPR) repeat protein